MNRNKVKVTNNLEENKKRQLRQPVEKPNCCCRGGTLLQFRVKIDSLSYREICVDSDVFTLFSHLKYSYSIQQR